MSQSDGYEQYAEVSDFDDGTFVIMTAEGPVDVSRTDLKQEDVEQLPSELFAAEPPLLGVLEAGKLETKQASPLYQKSRAFRDRALEQILKMTSETSGVAADPDLGKKIMWHADLYSDRWQAASRSLVKANCITTVKLGANRPAEAIVVHPGSIERAIQGGALSIPAPEHLEKLVRIARASRIASIQAVSRALGPNPISYDEQHAALERHTQETWPKTAAAFVGKEHFRELGEEAGVSKRASSRLFAELCFPVLLGSGDELEPILPEELGLVVKTREEVGLPDIPASQLIRNEYISDGVLAHIPDRKKARKALREAVVQIAGVAALDLESTKVRRALSPHALVTAVRLVPYLQEEFPAGPDSGDVLQ